MHERTFLLFGAAAAVLVVAVGLARSRAIDWQRLLGNLLPGWPWW